MKMRAILGKFFLCAAMSLVLGGCQTTKQARDVDAKGFLVNPDILTKGDSDQALYRYKNPKFEIKRYSSVMIEPVKFFKPMDATPEEVADIQKLAANFNTYLTQELSRDYTLVTAPQPGTMKVETAIVSADKSKPAMDFISTVMPIGLGISILKDFATGKPASVGQVNGEMKITDASTGELLGAAVDSRVGGKSLGNVFSSWGDANHAMEYWAKKVRYMLCKDRGEQKCEEPGNY